MLFDNGVLEGNMERGNVKSADSLGDLGCGEKNVKSLT